MARVGAVLATKATVLLAAPEHAPGEKISPRAESGALISLNPLASGDEPYGYQRRPLAAFVAQLIATDRQSPQTRARRRHSPEDAAAVYGAVRSVPHPAGLILRRSA
jgi:hypothetical protein